MNTSEDKFVEYYKKASLQRETLERFQRIQGLVRSCLGPQRYSDETLRVADIGCGAGVQSMLWAEDGHEVFGLDISKGLVEEAQKRATERGIDIKYCIGSAEQLPWESESVDVCLVPELLEHVQHWEQCLDEFGRILRPGGVLFLSTTNRLCPKQQEFELPFYSWYPGPLKRHCERLAVTTKPHWVQHAEYPAIHWFDNYILRREFERRNMRSLDRFDIYARENSGGVKTSISRLISVLPPLRFLVHVITPYSQVMGVKHGKPDVQPA